MINNTEFADRLRKIMDYYQLSASAFADRIQVQRSSISHLLSGRNKPSLDFVMRVVKEFKEVELYWLLNGKGSFPATSMDKGSAIDNNMHVISESATREKAHSETVKTLFHGSSVQKEIERIVVFYADGSFKAYTSL